MTDTFQGFAEGLDAPALHAAAVTPNDTTDLSTATRGIYIGGAGDLKVDMLGGETVTFFSVPAGTALAIRAIRVYVAGTTATNIVGLW